MEAKDMILLITILLKHYVFSLFSSPFLLLGKFCNKITLYILRRLSTLTVHFSNENHIPPIFSIPKQNDVEGEGMISMINILLGSHNLFLELFSNKLFLILLRLQEDVGRIKIKFFCKMFLNGMYL